MAGHEWGLPPTVRERRGTPEFFRVFPPCSRQAVLRCTPRDKTSCPPAVANCGAYEHKSPGGGRAREGTSCPPAVANCRGQPQAEEAVGRGSWDSPTSGCIVCGSRLPCSTCVIPARATKKKKKPHWSRIPCSTCVIPARRKTNPQGGRGQGGEEGRSEAQGLSAVERLREVVPLDAAGGGLDLQDNRKLVVSCSSYPVIQLLYSCSCQACILNDFALSAMKCMPIVWCIAAHRTSGMP